MYDKLCFVRQKGLQLYLFTWLNGFIANGPPKQQDIFDIPKEDSSLDNAQFTISNGLVRSLFRLYKIQILVITLLKLSLMGVLLANPLIVSSIVELFDSDNLDYSEFLKSMGIFLGWILTVYGIMSVLNFYQRRFVVNMQAKLSVKFYTKMFTSKFPLPSQGEITNLFQIDIPQISLLLDCGITLCLTPLQIIGAIVMYFSTVGVAASFGLIGMTIQVTISLLYGSLYQILQQSIMNVRDQRISSIEELLSGIINIKQNCYYKYFYSKILNKRKAEMNDIAIQQRISFGISLIFSLIPIGVMYFTIKIFQIFNLKTVLLVTQNYGQLIQAVNFIPYNLGQVLIAFTSIKRYMNFIDRNDRKQIEFVEQQDPLIIQEGGFQWHNDQQQQIDQQFQLSNISIKLEKGTIINVVGNNCSGKTSLIYALLGELDQQQGESFINKNISIATQEPFIFNGTIRENIICDNQFDKIHYEEILNVSQLLTDINEMPYGDQQNVGENGQQLSGGQRKRIHVARTLYKNSELYLLDCPFTSLDQKTAQSMMDDLWQLAKKHNKAILITSNERIKQCDKTLYLINGVLTNESINSQESSEFDVSQINEINEIEQQSKSIIQTSYNEEQAEGILKKELFIQLYNLYGKYPTLIIISLFCLFSMGCNLYYQMSLKSITQVADSLNSTGNQKMKAAEQFLFVYPISQILNSLIAFLNGIYLTQKGIGASVKLHNNIVNNLLKGSMSEFYNCTLTSVIKNRLSNDIYQFDTNTPDQIQSLVSNGFNLIAYSLACIILSSYISYPILICFVILQGYFTLKYLKINLEISRLIALSKTPLLNNIKETLNGILFNRHCRCQNSQISYFCKLYDIFIQNTLCHNALFAWFLQITCLLMLIMYVFIVFANYINKNNSRESSIISVYLSITVGEKLNGFIQQFQNFYNNNIYLERCLSLINIPKEDQSTQQYGEFENPIDRRRYNSESEIEMMTINSIVEDVDSQYAIQAEKITLKYKHSTVLKEASLTIKIGEKIAIIGRTGAGKTSLIYCLTRLVEPTSGSLRIFDQDTKFSSVNRIRGLFSVVSQDPFVFEGTIKENIDPNGVYNAVEIQMTLERYGLQQIDLFTNLDYQIEPNGQNLSLGQKQLLMLSRILMQRRCIVILDECTGNLDTQYSRLINSTLDLYMKDKTVIAVTHKLDMLDLFHRVIIVDRGRIIAEGSKEQLLNL